MNPQKYKQSEVHPRHFYLVLAGIIDDDSAAEGIDIAAAKLRHAGYIKSRNDIPVDCYVSCYHFMTQEFSDVTKEEAERYLLDDHIEIADSIPHYEAPNPQEQAALLQKTYPNRDDLMLGAKLFARLHTYSKHETYAHWREVFTCLNMPHPNWLCVDLEEGYIEF